MTSPSKHGCRVKTPARKEGEEFHEYMRRLYKEQPDLCPGNDHHVQAKLPRDLYNAFHQFIEQKGWSKSQAVQFAIYNLLNKENV